MRAPRYAPVLALALGATALAAPPPGRAEPLPTDLAGVDVEQKLDASVPLDLEFTDSDGRVVQLGDLVTGERPVLLTLNYYECPMLCTLVLDGVVHALAGLDFVPGREFDIVTVSIDPTEGPDLARRKKQNYLTAYGRPEAERGWHFLTGRREPIATLADAVGFRFRFVEDTGEYAHPAAVFVLTPDGRVARVLFGVRYDPTTVRLALVEAAAGRIGSPVDKLLLSCYRYDAEAGRYAPAAMRIMRLGGVLTAVVLGTTLVGFWLREHLPKRPAR